MSTQAEKWEVSARSETGYVREENQDRMSGMRMGSGGLYIVADGMGGHRGGALAAELTVQLLQRELGKVPQGAPVTEAIKSAFAEVNRAVFWRGHGGERGVAGMGSTAVVLLTDGAAAHVAHVGDSRAYLYRQGRLRQLTRDHSRVQRMVEAGMLTATQARGHPESSVLERAIGQKTEIEVDVEPVLPLQAGDGILLCSDGLSGYVDDQEIEAVLRSRATVQEVSQQLVDLALDKGGEDNVTVQFIQYGPRTEVQGVTKRLLYRVTAAVVAAALLAWVALFLMHKEQPHDTETQQPRSKDGSAVQSERMTDSNGEGEKAPVDDVDSESKPDVASEEQKLPTDAE